MKAGRLRHRIRIEQQIQGVDAFGAPMKTWATMVETNASVDSVSGREYFAAERDLGEETWKITMRRWPGFHLDGTFRAVDVDSGVVYDLRAVLDSHVRDMVTVTAKAGSSHS